MSETPIPESPGRRVVCAAILPPTGTNPICAPRHFDPIMRAEIKARCQHCSNPEESRRLWATSEQGFVDQRGVFLTRTEAWVVAQAAGQILRRVGGDTTNGGTLFSENLY